MRGSVRGPAPAAPPYCRLLPLRRVDSRRGTGLVRIGGVPARDQIGVEARNRGQAARDRPRRDPDSRSACGPPTDRLADAARNSNTSAATTSAGSFATTMKNVFRSKATARNMFGRARPATDSR